MTNSNPHQPKISLYYHPWSRAVGIRWLLEELGVDYDVRFVDLHQPGGIPEAHRAIHPHKKIPALDLDGQILTERAAITIYLADRFSLGNLAPNLDDPLRANYLKMIVYNDSVLDPSVALHFRKIVHTPADFSFGAYADTLRALKAHFREHPFAAGSRFTAADTQIASSLRFTIQQLQAVPEEPEFMAYLERAFDRPAYRRSRELDAQLLQAAHQRAS
jgi:glutathione S-transferase